MQIKFAFSLDFIVSSLAQPLKEKKTAWVRKFIR